MNSIGSSPMLVIAGEALVDLLTTADAAATPILGGSPYNLALALGRLGCAVSYRSPLSNDSYGEQFAEQLRAAGVSLSGGRCDLPTSLARVTIDSAGQASYRFEREAVADRSLAPLDLLKDWPVQARFFHVGSLALIPPDGEKWCELLGALNRRGVTTSVDINMRTMATADAPGYVATARAAAAQATWLKLSDDDLLALGLDGEPVAAARHLLGAVTKVVLLTLGAQGAWCLTQDEEMFEPAPCVEVLDTVGAGDCFYAGFLASLDEQQVLHMLPSAPKLRQAMALGTQAAAFSLQQRGCQPAWRREL